LYSWDRSERRGYCGCDCSEFRLPYGWIADKVCHVAKKWKCKESEDFDCPAGYYPTCADLNGLGFKRINNLSYNNCANQCSKIKKCLGFEYIYKKPNPLSVGSCLLNSKYPNQGPAQSQHTCYKYGAYCPPVEIVVPVKPIPITPVKPVYKPCQCEKFCKS